MNISPAFKRAARLVALAVAAGALLSGCAAATPDTADGCVGPADFCNVYFGS